METSRCEGCKDLAKRLQRALEVAQNRLDEYNKLLAEHKILQLAYNDLSWEVSPEGMER